MFGKYAAFATPTRACAASAAVLCRGDIGPAREQRAWHARGDRGQRGGQSASVM